MIRMMLSLASAAAVAGCAPAPRDIAIAGLDLGNPAVLTRLQQQLPLDDRGTLGTYALLHWPQSKFFCGEPIGGQQPQARTVGEAIDQTRAYDLALANKQAPVATDRGAERRAQEAAVINRLEQALLERDMRKGSGPTDRAAERNIEALRAELTALRR